MAPTTILMTAVLVGMAIPAAAQLPPTAAANGAWMQHNLESLETNRAKCWDWYNYNVSKGTNPNPESCLQWDRKREQFLAQNSDKFNTGTPQQFQRPMANYPGEGMLPRATDLAAGVAAGVAKGQTTFNTNASQLPQTPVVNFRGTGYANTKDGVPQAALPNGGFQSYSNATAPANHSNLPQATGQGTGTQTPGGNGQYQAPQQQIRQQYATQNMHAQRQQQQQQQRQQMQKAPEVRSYGTYRGYGGNRRSSADKLY